MRRNLRSLDLRALAPSCRSWSIIWTNAKQLLLAMTSLGTLNWDNTPLTCPISTLGLILSMWRNSSAREGAVMSRQDRFQRTRPAVGEALSTNYPLRLSIPPNKILARSHLASLKGGPNKRGILRLRSCSYPQYLREEIKAHYQQHLEIITSNFQPSEIWPL
jgi:hypothetical protein